MAILLIYDRDNTHKNPEKAARGCYKRGMVVQVFEDGTPCVKEPLPPFVIVNVPGVSKADAEAKYMAAETKLVTVEKEPVTETVRRRSMALDLAKVSLATASSVDTKRLVTLTTAALPTCEKSLVTAPIVERVK